MTGVVKIEIDSIGTPLYFITYVKNDKEPGNEETL